MMSWIEASRASTFVDIWFTARDWKRRKLLVKRRGRYEVEVPRTSFEDLRLEML